MYRNNIASVGKCVLTFATLTHGSSQRQTSTSPLFKLSGTVKFEAVGSVPALPDGSLVSFHVVLVLVQLERMISFRP